MNRERKAAFLDLCTAAEHGHETTVKVLLQYVNASGVEMHSVMDEKITFKWNADYPIRWATFYGHTRVVELLLACGEVNPVESLTIAAEQGHIEIVKLLFNDPRVNPEADDHHALRRAVQKGHLDVMMCFFSYVVPESERYKTWSTIALLTAAEYGQVPILLYLLPRTDPSVDENHAIRWAARNGHTEAVRFLLHDPRVDGTAKNHYAYHWAVFNKHAVVIELTRPILNANE